MSAFAIQHFQFSEDLQSVSIMCSLASSAYRKSKLSCRKLMHFLLLVSIIGWVAQRTGQTVEETAQAVGPGLAFFTVAEAMGLFGGAQNVMSVLFYVMLLTLGLVRLVLLSMSFHYSHPIINVNFNLTQHTNQHLSSPFRIRLSLGLKQLWMQ